METTPQPTRPTWEHRLHAVLALLGGEPVPDVTTRFGMGRSILYKWRRRALTALQGALTDHRPGPQCPANRLSPAQEHPLVELAQRHPTWSAAQLQAKAGPDAPSPRTIQRLRHRYALPRLPKRPAPCRPARRLTCQVKQEVAYLLAADIVSRLPSFRPSDDNQPVIMTRNRFSPPRSSLLACIGAHTSHSTPRSSTGILF